MKIKIDIPDKMKKDIDSGVIHYNSSTEVFALILDAIRKGEVDIHSTNLNNHKGGNHK